MRRPGTGRSSNDTPTELSRARALGLDPIGTYRDLIKKYDAPKLKSPYNLEARRLAGFEEEELIYLAANGL